jgi:hypothetical protein
MFMKTLWSETFGWLADVVSTRGLPELPEGRFFEQPF